MWTIVDLMRTVAAQGDRPVVITMVEDRAVAIGGHALAALVGRLGQGLLDAGLRAGEPLVIVGPNSLAWVVARLAAALIGAVPVACDDQSSDTEIDAIARDSASRLAFSSASHAGPLRRAGCTVYRLEDAAGEGPSWRDLLAEQPISPAPPPSSDARAMIVYTSGTTGAPKSFLLTHANIAANIEALLAARVIHRADRILLPLPLHHVFPLLVGMLTTLATGATLVFPAAPTGPRIAAALRQAEVTVLVGVPRLYSALLDGIEGRVAARGALANWLLQTLLALSIAARRYARLRVGRRWFDGLHRQLAPRLRLMVSGGAKLEGRLIWKLEGLGWQVLSGYGLAETASMFTGNLPKGQRIGSEGRPLGQGQMRIDDPDGEGIGEIQLRGPNVFAGYRETPDGGGREANRNAFTADGWFRTGDLGWIDDDGFLHVTGRLKEQIVLGGGKKVMPEEIERHYAGHPHIREIAVLEREGKLLALVLPDLATIRAAGMTRPGDAVRVALAEGGTVLPAYQRVAGFALARDPLPRTRLGKYQRFRLPSLYDAIERGETKTQPRALSAQEQALITASPAREVWEVLTARYAAKGLTLDSHLTLDLGLDSLEWMTVAMEIEARAGVAVNESIMAEAATARDLLAAITAAAAAAVEGGGPRVAAPLPEVAEWLKPTGPGMTLFGVAFYGLNWLLMRVLFRLRVAGAEQIPADGCFVLIANHVSDLDPPVLAASMSWRRLRRLYWAGDINRLFARGWQRAIARAIHIFPVDERNPGSTLWSAGLVLERGAALGWFPESWRSPTGELQRFLPGIGLILAQRPVMVIPAYVAGAFEALPRNRHWPRLHPIRVTFGRPIPADIVHGLAAEPDGPDRIVSLLHERVAELERAARATLSPTPGID